MCIEDVLTVLMLFFVIYVTILILVKAIADGDSTNTLNDVVEHCLCEIERLFK